MGSLAVCMCAFGIAYSRPRSPLRTFSPSVHVPPTTPPLPHPAPRGTSTAPRTNMDQSGGLLLGTVCHRARDPWRALLLLLCTGAARDS
eukprot:scaffold21812_cov110-Isochrysis_galbana.AAC.25